MSARRSSLALAGKPTRDTQDGWFSESLDLPMENYHHHNPQLDVPKPMIQ